MSKGCSRAVPLDVSRPSSTSRLPPVDTNFTSKKLLMNAARRDGPSHLLSRSILRPQVLRTHASPHPHPSSHANPGRLSTVPHSTLGDVHHHPRSRSCWDRNLSTTAERPSDSSHGKAAQRLPSSAKIHNTPSSSTIDKSHLIEEETLPDYRAELFYPVYLGQVFNHQYKVVAKLGYGSSSTIWLARDIRTGQYVALKIYIHSFLAPKEDLDEEDLQEEEPEERPEHRELEFHQHLEQHLPSKHPGSTKVRSLLDSFEATGPHGRHKILVLQASQMSLRDMDLVFMRDEGFEEGFVKAAIAELLEALDFFHAELQCVHTDIHPGNLLLGLKDDIVFRELEEGESTNPVGRKQLPDRTIYLSRLMKPQVGPLLLSDFGETRIGPGPHAADIMPIQYRAPEALLYIQWSFPVDLWSVGLTAWSLLQGSTLFTARKKDDGSLSDGAHFAELIAALGPPPPELLERHRERALEYWDENWNWDEFVPIPKERTLKAMETKLLQNNSKFLAFVRRALTWDPKKRPTAKELLEDPWLRG